MMGVPSLAYGPFVGRSKSTIPHLHKLDDLAGDDIQRLLGNGQHFAVMGAWIMYCMSNLMLKTDVVISPERDVFSTADMGLSLMDAEAERRRSKEEAEELEG